MESCDADLASRQIESCTEWILNRQVFKTICRKLYRPDVDLFASRLNCQLPRYATRFPDPGSFAVDAFLQEWSQWTSFINPPIVEVPSSGSMAAIRERYQSDGLSEEVASILLSSWSDATQKRYTGPWRAWAQWCAERDTCPISAPVTEVLQFLASLVLQGRLEYRTIAVCKSTISQTHDPMGSAQLGSLPVVQRFTKGSSG